MHAPWRATKRRTGGEVNHRPGTAAFDELLRHGLGAEEGAFKIDVEDLIPLDLGHIEKFDAGENAGVIHQDINTAKALTRFHHTPDIGSPGHITGNRHSPLPQGTNLGGNLFRRGLVVQVIKHHTGPLTTIGQGNRLANTLLCPGH